MPAIDAHQHFWQYDSLRHNWINDDMKLIRRDFLPGDLYPLLMKHEIEGCVVVQVDQSEDENEFQLSNAERFDFIKGVVGWVDLQANNIEERLEYYSSFNAMKGFRHILQGEKDRALMLQPAFKKGIALLGRYNFTYDILIFPDQLKYALELAKEFPQQRFVIDHIAKPYIKDGKIDEWKQDIRAFANCENVYCKISGMVTEADWKTWKPSDIVPYINEVVEAFGTKRIMYGSDWPVCLVAASYDKVFGIAQTYFSSFSADEQKDCMGENAIRFYNIN